jgi:predicted AlkP superfamily pyrophosphatase or phosphodiesterase
MRPLVIALAAALATPTAQARPPRLVVVVAVDSMGSDVFQRMEPRFRHGLRKLATEGAYFPDARYVHAQTVTSAGHATLSTGTSPWRHGITSNKIYDRTTGSKSTVMWDPSVTVLDAPPAKEDTSPAKIEAETLSDRLLLATQGRGKAVAVAGKSRAAIAFAGRRGQAWWFHEGTGRFVTSSWYRKDIPYWTTAFNDSAAAEGWFGKPWKLAAPASEYVGLDDRSYEADAYGLGRSFPHPVARGDAAAGFTGLSCTPASTELVTDFAIRALEAEGLGKDEVPDLLLVSFSGVDRAYHLYGPFSWETQDHLLRLDRALPRLFSAAEQAAGKGNVVVVLTADHGGAAIPEEWAEAGMPGTRVSPDALVGGLSAALEKQFGVPGLVLAIEELDLYLDARALAARSLDAAAVQRAAAAWLNAHQDVQLAVSADELATSPDVHGLLPALRRTFFPGRSGDVLVVLKPFRVLDDQETGTSHGSPWLYDAQVPLLLWGPGIRRGVYAETVSPTDVAPTLSLLLGIGAPASSEGRPLGQALQLRR